MEKFLGARYQAAEHDTPFSVLCPKELLAYQRQLTPLSHSAVSEKMRWLQRGAGVAASVLADDYDDEDEVDLWPLRDQ